MEFDAIRIVATETINLPIYSLTSSSPLILKAVDGLGPPEFDVNLVQGVNELSHYHGRRIQGREIVMRLGLNPDYSLNQTVSELRQKVYKTIGTGTRDFLIVQLLLENEPQVQTRGYLKKVEIVPFNKDPELQITIGCESAYFEGMEDIEVDVSPSGPLYVPDPSSPRIFNPGTAPTGVYFELTMIGQRTSILIWDELGSTGYTPDVLDNDDNGFILMEHAGNDYVVGDKIFVDTRPGKKSVRHYKVSDDTTYNDLGSVSAESSWWPMLHSGENTWSVPSNNDEFIFSKILFRPQYLGV